MRMNVWLGPRCRSDVRRVSLHAVSYLSNRVICLVAASVVTISMPWSGRAAGTWTPLANPAPEGISIMLLLPDGTVMGAGASAWNTWYRLTPDTRGSYANGNWTTLATMNFTRDAYSSAVLTNGTVLVAGGEYGRGRGQRSCMTRARTPGRQPPRHLLPIPSFPIHFRKYCRTAISS